MNFARPVRRVTTTGGSTARSVPIGDRNLPVGGAEQDTLRTARRCDQFVDQQHWRGAFRTRARANGRLARALQCLRQLLLRFLSGSLRRGISIIWRGSSIRMRLAMSAPRHCSRISSRRATGVTAISVLPTPASPSSNGAACAAQWSAVAGCVRHVIGGREQRVGIVDRRRRGTGHGQ